MPYINGQLRAELLEYDPKTMGFLLKRVPRTAGELNYVVSFLAAACMEGPRPFNYEHLSNIHKALVGAEREFYRRVLAPYEDQKIRENGDVYP